MWSIENLPLMPSSERNSWLFDSSNPLEIKVKSSILAEIIWSKVCYSKTECVNSCFSFHSSFFFTLPYLLSVALSFYLSILSSYLSFSFLFHLLLLFQSHFLHSPVLVLHLHFRQLFKPDKDQSVSIDPWKSIGISKRSINAWSKLEH